MRFVVYLFFLRVLFIIVNLICGNQCEGTGALD